MISRSPALVSGTGVDRPIRRRHRRRVAGDTQPAGLPVVPIDAIPVLMMTAPPLTAAGLQFLGQGLNGTPEAAPDGFSQRGDVWIGYTLTKVELIGPLSAGKTPATWWKSKSGPRPLDAQLARLSWVPEATPKAIGSSQFLEETVKEHWGTVCLPLAPAPVLWTFQDAVLGPSPAGWRLVGGAWPDPANSTRSGPTDVILAVSERWRCGDPDIDQMRHRPRRGRGDVRPVPEYDPRGARRPAPGPRSRPAAPGGEPDLGDPRPR